MEFTRKNLQKKPTFSVTKFNTTQQRPGTIFMLMLLDDRDFDFKTRQYYFSTLDRIEVQFSLKK